VRNLMQGPPSLAGLRKQVFGELLDSYKLYFELLIVLKLKNAFNLFEQGESFNE